MNGYTAAAIVNVAIVLLIALGVYWTGSLWALFGLFFLFSHTVKEAE